MQMSEESFEDLLDVMEKHFAALKLLDDKSEKKLTKPVHVPVCDLPSTHSRILLEQCVQHPNSPSLMRQYSCEQIVNPTDNTRQVKVSRRFFSDNNDRRKTWAATFPLMSNQHNSDWNMYKDVSNVLATNNSHQDQIEYMEIDKNDSLDNNTENTDTTNVIRTAEVVPSEPDIAQIPRTCSLKEKYEKTKKKCRPLASPVMETKNGSSTFFSFKLIFFMLIPVLVFLIAAFLKQEEVVKYTCDHGPYFSNASTILQRKIYGQDEVITSLSRFLETYGACRRMAVLVGSTGVGKSYTIDIIRRHFPTGNKIVKYYPPLNKADLSEISSYGCNLVVFENLMNQDDISDLVRLSTNIFKLETTCVTVLAVFHVTKVSRELYRPIQLDDKLAEIKATLSKADIDADIFGYKLLTEEALEKCIEQAAKDSHVTLSKSQIQEAKLSLMKLNSGCKGAYAKVQIIGRG